MRFGKKDFFRDRFIGCFHFHEEMKGNILAGPVGGVGGSVPTSPLSQTNDLKP